MIFAVLLMTPVLLLLVLLFAAPAEAQVGQQPDRNRRPPATATGGANANAGADGQQASYPGANEMLERAFIAMNLRKPASPPFHQLVRFHYEVLGQAQDGSYEIFWSGTQHYREVFKLGTRAGN